jgi:hypothetical protein
MDRADGGYEWGSKAASAASNKFKEGLLMRSKRIMALGIQMLIKSMRESLNSDDTFERLYGLSEFWNFVTATEMTSDKLRTLPKEFQSVLSSKKMFSAKKEQIPSDIKEILRELKEIIHVGELLKREGAENKKGFSEKSESILKSCEEKLGQIT